MQVHADFGLQASNTLALQARAPFCLEADSTADLIRAVVWSQDCGLRLVPLGEGSNIVFAGELDVAMLRVAIRGRKLVRREGRFALVRLGAGENWHSVVQWALGEGYYGLENLALIPGTVGAAPVQNIGAYGVELSSVLHRVHALELESGKPLVMSAKECALGYRDSVFKHRLRDAVVIHGVELRLPLDPAPQCHYPTLAAYLEELGIEAPTPADVFHAVVAIRSARLPDPSAEPNAGSFFKNPVVTASQLDGLVARYPDMPHFAVSGSAFKIPAAWLIEQCGWKGQQRAGVGVHPGHALVLVNYGADSGAELLALAADIQASVQDQFGVSLEIEPRVYGAV